MSINDFLQRVNYYILNPLILLMFALAFLYFVYGIVRFVSKESIDKDRVESRNAILWGLVGMFIMFSVYGLIRFTLATFGISPDSIPVDAQPYINFP